MKSGTYNSGRHLEHGPVKHHLAAFSCKTYIVKGLPRTGFGETATAGSVVGNKSAQAYQQVVFQFASTKQATAFYRQLYAFTVRCRTVTASFHGTVRLTTQSLKKTHLGRLPAFLAKQTLFATGFAATINDTLATVSGRTSCSSTRSARRRRPSPPCAPPSRTWSPASCTSAPASPPSPGTSGAAAILGIPYEYPRIAAYGVGTGRRSRA